MRTVLSLFLALLLSGARAQTVRKFYFNENLQRVVDSLAENVGVAVLTDSVWEMKIVGITDGRLRMHGFYRSDFEKPVGPASYYHPNGRLRMTGHYRNGEETGLWKSWDSSGRLTDSAYYGARDKEDFAYSYKYHPNGRVQTIEVRYGTTRSKKQDFEPDGKLLYEIEQNGLAAKIRHFSNGKLSSYQERDADGKYGPITRYDAAGRATRAPKQEPRAGASDGPRFPGGNEAFDAYLQRSVRLPRDYEGSRNLTFSFKLNAKGKAYEINTSSISDLEAARSVMNALQRMPNWEMNGRSEGLIHFNLTLYQ